MILEGNISNFFRMLLFEYAIELLVTDLDNINHLKSPHEIYVKYGWKWNWKSFSCVWLLCDPQDYTVRGILQARILEQSCLSSLAYPFSSWFSWPT